MGPRSEDRGNKGNRRTLVLLGPLQWGRDPRIAETKWIDGAAAKGANASMGPRSEDRGNG